MKKFLITAILGFASAAAVHAQGRVWLDTYNSNPYPQVTYGAGVPGHSPGTPVQGMTAGLYWSPGIVTVTNDPSGVADISTIFPEGIFVTGTDATSPTDFGCIFGGWPPEDHAITLTPLAFGPATFVVVVYDGTTYASSTVRGHSAGFSLTPEQAGTPPGVGTAMPMFQVHPTFTPTVSPQFSAWGTVSSMPAEVTNLVAIVAGDWHVLGLKSNGTVIAWGDNSYGQTNVPAGLLSVVAISGGQHHSMALRADGTVVAWGKNINGQTNVPAGLSNVVAIACGNNHSLALRADGLVVGWGFDNYGQATVPTSVSNILAIAGGGEFSLVLRSNRTIFGWGDNRQGQCNVPGDVINALSIAAGWAHTLALMPNGIVRAWGQDGNGQVSGALGESNISSVISAPWHSMALRRDGTVAAWGENSNGECNVPAGLSNVVALAAASDQSLALMGPQAPVVAASASSRLVPLGSSIVMGAAAIGAKPLLWQWQFNGTNILGATNAFLVLSDITSSNAGIYCAAVSNEFGLASGPTNQISVTGAEPPVVLTQPASRTNNAAALATFTATATGTAPLQYQWFKGDVALANGGNISGATTSTLALSNVLGADAGLYSVVISNAYGSVTSSVASLMVIDQLIVTQPSSRTNNAGTVATFTVIAGNQTPWQYEWFKGDVALLNGGKVSGATTSSLTLSNVLGGDAGLYLVVISNSFGSVTSSVASLTVIDPLILTLPSSRTNNAGTVAAFTVTAVGTTPLQYQWFKGAIPLTNGGNITGTTSVTFSVSNVLGADAGGYSVVITNTYGSVTSSVASLTVIDPAILIQPANQSVNAGQDATFNVTAAGTAPLQYRWSKSGMLLNDATNASLVQTNAQVADAGNTYQVVVSNAFGSVTSSVVMLTVNLSLPDTFNPGANSAVYSLALQSDGKILVGGSFTNLGGQSRSYIGRLNGDGTLDTTFNPGANGTVYSLALQSDGKILVGGFFANLGGQSRISIGRLNPNGAVDPTFNPGANGPGFSLALQSDGKILVGGSFGTLGGQSRSRIGRLNADGTLDITFNPGANNNVNSLALQADGKILVGGDFGTLGGQSRSRIGRLNADGTLDTTFNPGAGGSVNSIALQADGKILVGGLFSTLGGQSRSNIGRLNADGTLDPTFNPGANHNVYSLALQSDGRILVGGGFGTLGGQSRVSIGRLNADGTLDPTINPGASSQVNSLALQSDGKILVGGSFGTLGGQSRSRIGRLENTAPATRSIAFDGSSATWLRGGTAPEFTRVTLDVWLAGSWFSLGSLSRIAGGWQITGLPLSVNSTVRLRGATSGGWFNASSGIQEAFSGQLLITGQPASRTNNAGTAAAFSVTAVGSEPMKYQWFKGSAPLADGGSIIGSTNGTLAVNSLLLGDAGAYSVIITNAFGSVTSSVATLTVLLPPQQFTAQSVDGGLSIQFSGTPNYPYILQSATNLVPPINWQSILTNAADADGRWSVTVTNIMDVPNRFYRTIGQ